MYKTTQNIGMSGEILLERLKRERDICVKTEIPSQNTAFRKNPALREKAEGLLKRYFPIKPTNGTGSCHFLFPSKFPY